MQGSKICLFSKIVIASIWYSLLLLGSFFFLDGVVADSDAYNASLGAFILATPFGMVNFFLCRSLPSKTFEETYKYILSSNEFKLFIWGFIIINSLLALMLLVDAENPLNFIIVFMGVFSMPLAVYYAVSKYTHKAVGVPLKHKLKEHPKQKSKFTLWKKKSHKCANCGSSLMIEMEDKYMCGYCKSEFYV